jgi:hypothetical protein
MDMSNSMNMAWSVTNKKSYGSTYSNDSTVSDLAADLPTSGPVGPDGYPTDLLAVPADSATYLVRYFNSESADGTSTTTSAFGDLSSPSSTTAVTHDHYTGANGYRDYETTSNFSGYDGNGPTLSTDETTSLLNYQREGSYGGTRDSNLTTVGMMGVTGSTTNENHDAGTIFANQADYQDVYHRDDGHTVVDGTFTADSGDKLTPSTYSDSASDVQVYQNSWLLASDQLTYKYAQSTDADLSVSDKPIVAAANYNGPLGTLSGTTDEKASVSVTGTRHSESVTSGVLNQLDHTGTVNNSASYLNTNDSTATDHQYYLAADGSSDQTTDSSSNASATASGDYTASGGVSAAGQQTDGSSYLQTDSVSHNDGTVTRVTTGDTIPVQKSVVKTDGDSITGATSDLTYNSDGSADGSVTSSGDFTSNLETTVTAVGSYTIPGGAGSANDTDHRKTSDHLHTSTDIDLFYGLATGTASSKTDHRTDFDHSFKRLLDLDDNSLHSMLTSTDAGFVASTDVVNGTVTDGVWTGARTFDYTQHDLSNSHLAATGNLSDSNGHTGNWNFDAVSTDTVGGASGQDNQGVITADPNGQDHFNQTFAWLNGAWVPAAPTVTTGDAGARGSSFHQQDNGLGELADDPSILGTYLHKVDVGAARYTLTIQSGTLKDNTFQTKSYQENDALETRHRDWSDANGNSGSWDAVTHSGHALRDDHNGITAAGVLTQDQIHQIKEDSTNATWDWQKNTLQNANEIHTRDYVSLMDTRDGDMGPGGSGTGSRDFKADHRNWWKIVDKTALWPFQVSSGGNPGAPMYTHTDSLGWGGPTQYVPLPYTFATIMDSLSQDFLNSPEGQWIGEHAGDLLRVVGGAADFAIGFTMTLGSGGLAVLPGVGLMAIGIDQIFVGETAIAFGVRPPSIFESLGSFGATAVGANPQTAQIVGAFTPAVLSLLFTLGGGLLQSTDGVLGAASDGIGTSPRPLPADVESQIIKLYPGDTIPAVLGQMPEYAATTLGTGQIFVNGAVWDALSDSAKARIFFEELSHQGRILATPGFLRPVRGFFIQMSDTYRFVEEMRAGWDATGSFSGGFSHAWFYPGISQVQIAGELGAGIGIPAYITWRFLQGN